VQEPDLLHLLVVLPNARAGQAEWRRARWA
jgi:hypothetical protein